MPNKYKVMVESRKITVFEIDSESEETAKSEILEGLGEVIDDEKEGEFDFNIVEIQEIGKE